MSLLNHGGEVRKRSLRCLIAIDGIFDLQESDEPQVRQSMIVRTDYV